MSRYRACVNCGKKVRAPRPGTISQAHRGHVEEGPDSDACGVWGWEWRTEEEPEPPRYLGDGEWSDDEARS